MIDARDIAAAAVTALTTEPAEGRVYTLTGPRRSRSTRRPTCSAGRSVNPRHVRFPPRPCSVAPPAPKRAFADMAALHGMLANGYKDVVTD